MSYDEFREWHALHKWPEGEVVLEAAKEIAQSDSACRLDVKAASRHGSPPRPLIGVRFLWYQECKTEAFLTWDTKRWLVVVSSDEKLSGLGNLCGPPEEQEKGFTYFSRLGLSVSSGGYQPDGDASRMFQGSYETDAELSNFLLAMADIRVFGADFARNPHAKFPTYEGLMDEMMEDLL